MKAGNELAIVRKQFLKAVDYFIAHYKKTGDRPDLTKDSGYGKIIYESNRYIIDNIREDGKGVPHVALVKFADHFNIDYNYFYTEGMELTFRDQKDIASEVPQKAVDTKIVDLEIDLFQKRYHHIVALFDTCSDEALEEYKQSTGKIVEVFSAFLKNNYRLHDRKEYELLRDQLLNMVQQGFQRITVHLKENAIHQDNLEELIQLKKELPKWQEKIDILNEEVKAYSKMAIDAQRSESETLKQLLALKS